MTIRLSTWLRDEITKAAVQAAFEDREATLALQEDALARSAYEAVYSATERAQAMAMPENWLRRDRCLSFTAQGMNINLTTTSNHLPVPYETKGSRGYECHHSHGNIANPSLAEKIVAHANAKEALKAERKLAVRQLSATLRSISTIAKLRQAWPEGEAFYAVYETAKAPQLPAVQFSTINAALGLVELQS